MIAKQLHLVFTTIFVPQALDELRSNAERFGHLEKIKIWIVGDRKTPSQTIQLCADATRKGLDTEYFGIDQQDAWGSKFSEFYEHIPYNNETRRNLGYLRALEEGCETLISVDDDNFPTSDDFFGGHLRTGGMVAGPLINEPSGYHNVCEYLRIEPNRPLYPRGFPFQLRGQKNSPHFAPAPEKALIGVTAGLWLKEPDIDATAWLNGKVESVGYAGPEYFTLDHETWSPINTQNTSVTRELIAGFLCVPMGHSVPGGTIQRYGDIWGGYFLQAVMAGTPYHVSFGRPLVEHRRNPHNYVDDLRYEFWGMILTDWLVQLLRSEFRPSSRTIIERVLELGIFLKEVAVSRVPDWCPTEVNRFLTATALNLGRWAAACKSLQG